jgi:hypothetical protein
VPAPLRDAERLLRAPDVELRQLDGVLALVAARGDTARIVTGAAGITALYRARSEKVEAWCSHAVAAGWLARGVAGIDRGAVPELLSTEFVGGDRTIIEGVEAVPTATRVEVGPDGATAHSYWPARERWARLPEDEAQAHGERALLERLAGRLADAGPTFLGLTAGLDSRVAAVALNELDHGFEAFTWGEPGWDDVEGAREVAAAVGAAHRRVPVDWLDDEAARARIDANVRWSEGQLGMAFNAETWPDGMAAYVYGTGGETGRCFYYREAARRYHEPPSGIVRRSWRPEGRLDGADPDALAHVRQRVAGWIEEAEQLEQHGWRSLDVVYAEQRVRRWGRAMLPRTGATVIPVFSVPEVSRALASLPQSERAADGFHRRFLSARCPALAPPPAAPAAPSRLRSRARLLAAPLGRPAAALLRRSRRPAAGPWFASPMWHERPALRSWLGEAVLASPVLTEPLGREWAQRLREAFLRDESHATETLLLAAAVVALDDALAGLTEADAPGAGQPP